MIHLTPLSATKRTSLLSATVKRLISVLTAVLPAVAASGSNAVSDAPAAAPGAAESAEISLTRPGMNAASAEYFLLTDSAGLYTEQIFFNDELLIGDGSTRLPKVYYGASLQAYASTSGKFAPYYVASNNNGLITQADGLQAYAYIDRPLRRSTRFSWGFGAAAAAGWSNAVDYERYNHESGWGEMSRRPAAVMLQNLYGEVKYRGVFARFGMKENDRSIFDDGLNSGDIVYSSNARPVPQLRVGFIDFQDIPFTNGWVQIQGEVAYGKFCDNVWLRNHYNRYNRFVTTDPWLQYSRAYFRTNPRQPFSATVGMQHATQFGGRMQEWRYGEMVSEEDMSLKLKDFFNAFLPWKGGGSSTTKGDTDYYSGNHLGSWDVQLRYRFRDGSSLTAYCQLPWEDGSGIGKLNGWDGVWGLRYKASGRDNLLSEAVLEYIDFTNQSGPMHWAPGDKEGTGVSGEATGADDYYNNFMYNGWANYGMAMGSPFVKSPIYNRDGYMRFTDNRVRGFHFGATGQLSRSLNWRLLGSYRQSLGTPFQPAPCKRHDTSLYAGVTWRVAGFRNLFLSGMAAYDTGNLYGDNFGALVALRYTGAIF